MSKVTFFLVCKNGGRDEMAEEEKDIVEIDTDYREALKMLRGTTIYLKNMIEWSRKWGLIK